MFFVRKLFSREAIHAAPLAVFRIAFGLMIFISIVRFWTNNWIEELYIKPVFFFSYYGFEWVKPLGDYTYIIFIICGASALTFAIGWKYRLSAILLFLSFTYIELMDKTTYLNHYYFVSVVSLLMIFLPAHVYFSADSWISSSLRADKIPAWTRNVLIAFIAMVYFYAGLAKINSDWLLHAMPLKLWLPARNDLPLIGPLFNLTWVPFIFSWFGAIYDLTIPFFLLWRKTRFIGYLTVISFHGLTAALFQIGLFPYVMIVATLIFFSPAVHQKILNKIAALFCITKEIMQPKKTHIYRRVTENVLISLISTLLLIQLITPFRHLLYPGELFWTEEGYRFSWRVMLLEKTGYATFYIVDGKSDRKAIVNNSSFLTPLQEKMMSTQTDMILQYAHYLKKIYSKRGFEDPKVYGEIYVTLNGRQNILFIDPSVDLARQKDSFKHKSWILPFNDKIKGF